MTPRSGINIQVQPELLEIKKKMGFTHAGVYAAGIKYLTSGPRESDNEERDKKIERMANLLAHYTVLARKLETEVNVLKAEMK